MTKVIRRGSQEAPKAPVHRTLRAVKLGEGLPSIFKMEAEIQDYMDLLLGRVEPPIDYGILTLMEYADAYFARGMEMTILIQQLERDGKVSKSSDHYKFRTGTLRNFCELAKKASELGSRRLTLESLKFEAAKTGRDSRLGFYDN